MEAAPRRAHECHQFCPASHDWEMIRAQQRNRTWYAHRDRQRKDSARGCTRQFPQNRPRLPATTRSSSENQSGTQSGTEDSVHLAAHVLVGDGFALIERGKALANLLPKPFVMVKVGRNQLAHHLVWSFACLRGDPG